MIRKFPLWQSCIPVSVCESKRLLLVLVFIISQMLMEVLFMEWYYGLSLYISLSAWLFKFFQCFLFDFFISECVRSSYLVFGLNAYVMGHWSVLWNNDILRIVVLVAWVSHSFLFVNLLSIWFDSFSKSRFWTVSSCLGEVCYYRFWLHHLLFYD